MKYLIQGGESFERIELLLQLTEITSYNVISAINDYYVKGLPLSLCCSLNGVDKSQLSRAMKSLEAKTAIHERLKEEENR